MSASQSSIRARISISIALGALVVMLVAVTMGALPSPARAASVGEFEPLAESPVDLTSEAIDPTTQLIYAQQNQGKKFFVYDPRTNEWTELAEAPINSGNNGGAAYLNGKIYTAYTGNGGALGVYDIAKNEWSVIENPLEAGTGNITAVGDSLYLLVENTFVKYNPATEVKTTLAEPPVFEEEEECSEGGYEPWGGIQLYQGKLYAHRGNGCNGFAVYDLASDKWTLLAHVPEGAVLGSAIDPLTGTYYAYGSYGGLNFYRYDIAGNTWSTIPLAFEEEVDDGGMVYVSLPGHRGIYAIKGEAGTEFTRYVTPEAEADLALTKSASVSSTTVGGEITYTIGVTNGGPTEAPNVTVSDPLPSNVSLVSSSASQGSCSGSSTVTCALGGLNKNAAATVTITVKATGTGTAANTATVKSDAVDPNAANNSATAVTSVVSSGPPPLNPARWLVPNGKLVVKGGWVSDPLQNLNSTLTLSGTAQLVTYGTSTATELASNTVYLAPGATKTLFLHLNSAAMSKLRAGHRVKVQLLLNLHDEFARTVKASGVYVLIGRSVHRHHKAKHHKKKR